MSEQVLAFSFECEGWGCGAVGTQPPFRPDSH